jgi:hypothetical protein
LCFLLSDKEIFDSESDLFGQPNGALRYRLTSAEQKNGQSRTEKACADQNESRGDMAEKDQSDSADRTAESGSGDRHEDSPE